ncbi:hypothetical protein C3K47_04295 [Solitalea longa]|uniref:DUF4843 domain-containing protein n=1 Tax=Solitalea longa TaxID=2079460 RepID=A0A2S5A7P3_9SPHI|nr:DUF4843 domain-containing protein [Solitalea longa]POY38621.1 hypothetical protein C3K47_04295 [Solitalea longa]
MKLKVQYIFVFLAALSIIGCAKDPALYSESDGLYFGSGDSIIYSFAKYPKKTYDTIQIPVKVLGLSSAQDRPITLEVVSPETNAALEGKEFKLPVDAMVKANSYTGTVPVVVYRTPDLETNTLSFYVKIKPNAGFPGEAITASQKVKIKIAYMQEPANWGDLNATITTNWAGYKDNFGTWTPTKYKVILDALYDETTGTTITEFPGNRFANGYPIVYNSYITRVKNYIKTNYPGNYNGGKGDVLLDPDHNNDTVRVGDAKYAY